MTDIRLHVRHIEPADQAQCLAFDAGDDAFAIPITRFIREDYWDDPSQTHVLIGIDPKTGAVAGYGTWLIADALPTWKKGEPPAGWTAVPWVRIPRFGLDRFYQGGQDDQGIKHADYLYACIERAILEAEEVEPGMWIELFVDSRNERAMRFWQRQGFADIGTSEGKAQYRRFMRHPWPQAGADALTGGGGTPAP